MKLKCPNCQYEWDSKAVLDSVTCPNCQRKFNKKNKERIIREVKNGS